MEPKGAPPGELSVWQKQEKRRQEDDAEARSVTLQPIQDHKAQRIKNKLSHCLNRVVRRLAVDVPCPRFHQALALFRFSASRDVRAEILLAEGWNSRQCTRCRARVRDSSKLVFVHFVLGTVEFSTF